MRRIFTISLLLFAEGMGIVLLSFLRRVDRRVDMSMNESTQANVVVKSQGSVLVKSCEGKEIECRFWEDGSCSFEEMREDGEGMYCEFPPAATEQVLQLLLRAFILQRNEGNAAGGSLGIS